MVRGKPPVTRFKWFKNEAPLEEERGRIRIRSKTDGATDAAQWSRVRFNDLETMDMGFYRCEANNGLETISGETVIKVRLGSNSKRKGTKKGFLRGRTKKSANTNMKLSFISKANINTSRLKLPLILDQIDLVLQLILIFTRGC